MCYTVKIDHTREALEKRFGAGFRGSQDYVTGSRISAFDLPMLPVICCEQPDRINIYQWGLIPYWTKNATDAQSIRMKTFNARAESLCERSAYRDLVNKKHCLVPVSGFYEWQHTGNKKIPWLIGVRDQQIFSIAGLYDHWTDKTTGETMSTFTILTTRANPMMENIHNTKKRMPVILSQEDEKEWLNTDCGRLNELTEPFPEERMVAGSIVFNSQQAPSLE